MYTHYEYRCGTCKSRELVIRPVAPGSMLHPDCFNVWCGNGHQLVGTWGTEITVGLPHAILEFRTNRRR
jgi:hypothetical protein